MIVLPIAGCDGKGIASKWRSGDIIVDGRDDDWSGVPRLALEESVTEVAVANDAENMYLLFRTRDKDLARMLKVSGLTVWFDPYGRNARTFTVRYPAAGPGMGRPPMDGAGGDDPAECPQGGPDSVRPAGDRPGPDGDSIGRPEPVHALARIALAGPEPGDSCMLLAAAAMGYGIRAAAATDHGTYVCELRVPLRETKAHPYAVAVGGTDSAAVVGIGVSAGGLGRHGTGMPGGGMPGGGRTGGFGGRGGGHMGPPPGAGGRGMPKAVEFWSKIRLRLVPPAGN